VGGTALGDSVLWTAAGWRPRLNVEPEKDTVFIGCASWNSETCWDGDGDRR
jgi:hypothetical protein